MGSLMTKHLRVTAIRNLSIDQCDVAGLTQKGKSVYFSKELKYYFTVNLRGLKIRYNTYICSGCREQSFRRGTETRNHTGICWKCNRKALVVISDIPLNECQLIGYKVTGSPVYLHTASQKMFTVVLGTNNRRQQITSKCPICDNERFLDMLGKKNKARPDQDKALCPSCAQNPNSGLAKITSNRKQVDVTSAGLPVYVLKSDPFVLFILYNEKNARDKRKIRFVKDVKCSNCPNIRYYPIHSKKIPPKLCSKCYGLAGSNRIALNRVRFRAARDRQLLFGKIFDELAVPILKANGTVVTLGGEAVDVDLHRIVEHMPNAKRIATYDWTNDKEKESSIRQQVQLRDWASAGKRQYTFDNADVFTGDHRNLMFANLDLEMSLTDNLRNQVIKYIKRNVKPGRPFSFVLNTTARAVKGHDRVAKDKVWSGLISDLRSAGFEVTNDLGRNSYHTPGSSTMHLYGASIS